MRIPSRLTAATIGLLLAAWVVGAPPEPIPDDGNDDPFPIQRVLLPRDRVPAELEKARQGTLVKLPRTEFEKRVRAAASALRQPARPPLLVAASYRARLQQGELSENALIGTAEWKFAHAGPGPGLFNMNGVQFAIKRARWADNRDAVIGLLSPQPGDGMSLLVDEPGDASLALDWSSRGVPEQGAIRFDLAVPPTPAATLELELPARFRPILPQDDAVVQQEPALDDDGETRTWRIAFGGLTHLEIIVRPAASTTLPRPVIEFSVTAKQDVQPTLVHCEAAIAFRALNGEVTDLVLDYDPELTITDITGDAPLKWTAVKVPVNGRKRARVQLASSQSDGKLRITGTVPTFSLAQPWTSPGVNLVGAVPRGEKLSIRISPELRLTEWKPGTFTLKSSEFTADKDHLLDVESGPLPDGQMAATRPSARFRMRETDFRVRQSIDFSIGSERSTLASRLMLDVRHGSLTSLTLQIPVGWEVERIESAPGEPGLTWTQATPTAPQAIVELARPVTIGGTAEFTVRLSQPGPRTMPGKALTLAFPDVVPVGAALRSGVYSIQVGPLFRASGPALTDADEQQGPPPEQSPALAWQGRFVGLPPAGPLLLSSTGPAETPEAKQVPAPVRSDVSIPTTERTTAIDDARVIAVMQPDSTAMHAWRFTIRDPNAPYFAVELAEDCQFLRATVNGREIDDELIKRDGPGKLAIPIPAFPATATVELLYRQIMPPWSWTTELRTALPTLQVPCPPSTIEWRLPPGVLPAQPHAMIRLPGGPAVNRPLSLPVADELIPTASEFRERPFGEAQGKQPKGPATPRSLYQILSSTTTMPEKPIVDLHALADLDIRATTPVAGPTLESLGLVLVSTPTGQVLTSPREYSLWKSDGAGGTALPESIRSAVRSAALTGRDDSGRFRTVDDWMQLPDQPISLTARLGGDGPGWTAWQMRDPGHVQSIIVARADRFTRAGWVGAVLIAGFGLLAVRGRGRAALMIALVLLLLAGALLAGLPPAFSGVAAGPFVALLLVSLACICRRHVRFADARTVASARPSRLSKTSAAGAILLSIALAAQAQAPPVPATVYLLPAVGKEDEPRSMLAPPELLERLTALSRPKLALTDAAILRARFTGRADVDRQAEFEARYETIVFAERATIVLPVGDVRLREVLLDGAAAYPKPVGTDKIAIDIAGRGEHRIDVRFSVTVTPGNPDREIRFTTPDVPIAELDFTAPASASQVRAINWRGAQSHADDGRVLRADLGRTRTVQLRFREGTAEAAPVVKTLEAGLWELSPRGNTLKSAIEYRISQGNVSAFNVLIPAGLAITRVDVRPETPPVGSPPVWVRQWTLAPNRVLKVDLQGSLTGTVRLFIEAIPLKPPATRLTLEMLVAQGVTEAERYAALRLTGLETVEEIERKGANEIPADTFLRDVWRPLALERAAGPVKRAWKSIKSEPIVLRAVVRPDAQAVRATQETLADIGPRQVELRGTIEWFAGTQPLSFVEWEVPAVVRVIDVRGLQVQSWMRNGNQVIAWLREPTREPTIIWRGTLPRMESAPFETPVVRPLSTGAVATKWRLHSPAGWSTQLEGPGTGVTLPESPQPREIIANLARPSTPLRLQLRPPQTDAAFAIGSHVAVEGTALQFTATIEPTLRRDRPHAFHISAAAADGWKSDGPAGTGFTSRAIADGWEIDVPPREKEPLAITLKFTRPLTGKETVDLPRVETGAGSMLARTQHSLRTTGPNVRQVGPRRVEAAPQPLDTYLDVRSLLTEAQAVSRGHDWVYRAAFYLNHERETALTIRMPAGTSLAGLAIGEQRLPIDNTVTLPGDSSFTILHLVWRSDSPVWNLPTLESNGKAIDPGRVLWSAAASAGQSLDVAVGCTAAMHYLMRAETLLREAAVERSPAELQEHAGRALRLAEVNLNTPRGNARIDETGPGGIAMTDWLAKLREQLNTGRSAKAPAPAPGPRESVVDELPFAESFRGGEPVRWIANTEVRLRPAPIWSPLPALATFSLIALAIAVLALLSITLDRVSRPEQVALVGVLGFVAFGPPEGLIFLAITVVAILVRVISMGRHGMRLVGA